MARSRAVAGVVKRDGRAEAFDEGKIVLAVKRCFVNGVGSPEAFAESMGRQVSRAVANVLGRGAGPAGVEDVQRLVIQQLWSLGLFDAAEHYSRYREDHAKARRELPLPAGVQERVEEDARHFPSPLQYYQFISKFSRWREADRRRETWRETCDRTMNWFKALPQVRGVMTEGEWREMDSALYGFEASCAMRVLQMAGPALDRCHSGVYNCSATPLDDLESFAEFLYLLMQGCGVGFSVEREFVDRLPAVKRQRLSKGRAKAKHKVADSTEGWCDALLAGLRAWFGGEDVEFDDSDVRPANAVLRTKGGRASGPEPLRRLLTFARSLVLKRQGGRLTDLDCHDLACMEGKIVQVGGVRRAATLSVSDLDSEEMRSAKAGPWYEKAPWRTMANNSAAYPERPGDVEFLAEWHSLAASGSGERGLFNRWAVNKHLPARRKRVPLFLINPCAEIILRPRGFCNLSICIARIDDTAESLARKVRVATFFGAVQSTCTKFSYIRDEWRKNAEEERLLGVDVTGHADCPLLRYGAPGRAELLRHLRGEVAKVRVDMAKRLGINESAADTCVKPSGDSGVFFDCASGVSPRFSKYQIRWVRERGDSPVARFLKDSGVTWAEAPEDPSLVVFAFPKKAPEGSTLRNDLTSVQQLENWLEWKREWAEHSVSASVYVGPDEWVETGAWVLRHFDDVTSVAFQPRDDGNYRYTPNEEITEAQYEEMLAKFPALNWAKLSRYEGTDLTDSAQTVACGAGGCDFT